MPIAVSFSSNNTLYIERKQPTINSPIPDGTDGEGLLIVPKSNFKGITSHPAVNLNLSCKTSLTDSTSL
jgi:hypothetical protein